MSTVPVADEGPPAFAVDVVRRGRHARVTARGELDIATAPVLDEALIEQARIGGSVMLDLRELTFIDATGLAVLLRLNARAQRDRIEFTLLPGPRVRRLLDLCGLTPQFRSLDPQAGDAP